MTGLRGKVVLITGGSSGLGAATALRLGAEGAKVVVAARRRDKGEATAGEVTARGGEGVFIQTDVTAPGAIEAMVSEAVRRFGRLDGAVNCAGVTGPAFTPVADIEEAGWDEVMATNLRATWLSMKHEIRAMLTTGGGAIVNLSSIYGYKGSDLGHAPYCASKHAVIGLTKSAAADYADQGVRVNAVCPGFTHSEMVDPYVAAEPALMRQVVARHSAMDRLGEAEETAQAIAWLVSPASSFVNGTVLTVDGGDSRRLYGVAAR